MYSLSIDSTTKRLSITLSRDGKILSRISDEKSQKYMERIMGHIHRVLGRAGTKIGDIDIFGINAGPGDFTGTRIGVSIIKTLSWVLEKPAYGVNSLDVFALGIIHSNSGFIGRNIKSGVPVIIMPCLDVRKEELYYSFYSLTPGDQVKEKDDNITAVAEMMLGGKPYNINRISRNHLVQKDSFIRKIKEHFGGDGFGPPYKGEKEHSGARIILGGNCVLNYWEMLMELDGSGRRVLLDKKNVFPRGKFLDICVNYLARSGVKPERMNPVYVREFIPFGK